jgi:UDP-2,4-diacetamido-2,4,6-trideoxy-beta-L-altropyranose hydrolase
VSAAALDVVIRAEGGAAIGLGHLRRCFSIALGLAEIGGRWRFACVNGEAARAVTDQVETIGAPAWSAGDAEEVAAFCARTGAALVLVDSYDAADSYLAALRAAGLRVAVMQDAPRAVPADIVINPAIQAEPPPGAAGRFLGGVTYMPLRPEFRDSDTRAGAERNGILITVGGSDANGLSAALVDAVAAAAPGVPITCIAGPYFGRADRLQDAISRVPGARLIVAPASMAPLMRAARVAVSGAGQTLYELAACGTPSVAIEIAGNQHPQAIALDRAGVVKLAGAAADPSIPARAASLAAALLNDESACAAMQARGRALVDGKGALRVAQVLLDTVRAA